MIIAFFDQPVEPDFSEGLVQFGINNNASVINLIYDFASICEAFFYGLSFLFIHSEATILDGQKDSRPLCTRWLSGKALFRTNLSR